MILNGPSFSRPVLLLGVAVLFRTRRIRCTRIFGVGNPVQTLQILLPHRFRGDEIHLRTRSGLTNRLSINGIVLIARYVRGHKLRRYDFHLMSPFLELPRKKVCTGPSPQDWCYRLPRSEVTFFAKWGFPILLQWAGCAVVSRKEARTLVRFEILRISITEKYHFTNSRMVFSIKYLNDNQRKRSVTRIVCYKTNKVNLFVRKREIDGIVGEL